MYLTTHFQRDNYKIAAVFLNHISMEWAFYFWIDTSQFNSFIFFHLCWRCQQHHSTNTINKRLLCHLANLDIGVPVCHSKRSVSHLRKTFFELQSEHIYKRAPKQYCALPSCSVCCSLFTLPGTFPKCPVTSPCKFYKTAAPVTAGWGL